MKTKLDHTALIIIIWDNISCR